MRTRPSCIFALISVFLLGLYCCADTFTNKNTSLVFHGYLTSQTAGGSTIVYTVENGYVPIKLSQWQIIGNRLGRKNKVIIIRLEEKLSLQTVVESLDAAIIRAADEGPLFVLLEMNSPGGRADYIERICDRLIRTDHCPLIAFVKTGSYSGAISGAAAIALACDKIYMSPDTIIGAATLTDNIRTFENDKLSIAWQEYLGTLARRSARPQLLARAMVDKDIEVIEVIDRGARRFIEPGRAEPNQTVVRVWSRGGSLLTLTATEAVQTDIAEAIAVDRADVLRKMEAADTEVVLDDSVGEAARTFKKAKLKFNRLRNNLDGRIKRIERTDNLEEAINLLREIKGEYKSLLLLAKRYPDLYLDVELIEEQLDSAEDYYERAKVKKRTLTTDTNEKAYNNH